MFTQHARHSSPLVRLAAVSCGALLATSACASDASSDTDDPTATASTLETTTGDTTAESATTESGTIGSDTAEDTISDTDATTTEPASTDCEAIAAQFTTRGSANPDLDDPEVNATCDGDNLVVTGNGIPDYTYIETSPGQPRDRDLAYTIPASPTVAEETTPIPYIGTSAVTISGIPIFGPTEGTGGDVESLPGILSDCGSHNGPSGFHIHLILTSAETDCLFTPEQVAAEPQLVGYAFDGFPIYTGADQYTSSWELVDEELFATDTWAAHAYVEGSGDLDECNGLTDADGNYAYYTTTTFPYIMGCYTGVVDLDAAGGGGGGGDDEGDGDRPARPDDDAEADADRPARPDDEVEGG